MSKMTDQDWLLPLADLFFSMSQMFVFIKIPIPQRRMAEKVVLRTINRKEKSLRIVTLDDFRIFYKLSCLCRPAANAQATLSKFGQNYCWGFLVAACRLPLAACRAHIYHFKKILDLFRAHLNAGAPRCKVTRCVQHGEKMAFVLYLCPNYK